MHVLVLLELGRAVRAQQLADRVTLGGRSVSTVLG
jgi:hypothetical protein